MLGKIIAKLKSCSCSKKTSENCSCSKKTSENVSTFEESEKKKLDDVEK